MTEVQLCSDAAVVNAMRRLHISGTSMVLSDCIIMNLAIVKHVAAAFHASL